MLQRASLNVKSTNCHEPLSPYTLSILCSSLVLSLVTQAKATAELVLVPGPGKWAAMEDFLSEGAFDNIKVVSSIVTCDVVSGDLFGLRVLFEFVRCESAI